MLREMAADERPRETLNMRGSAALSDGEFLAMNLNSGVLGATVTDISQRLQAHHGGPRGFLRLEVAELALGTAASVSGQCEEVPISPSEAHDRGGIAHKRRWFAALEAQFAAFEVRAENGFGEFW